MDRASLEVVVGVAQHDPVDLFDLQVADRAGPVPASGADLQEGSLQVLVGAAQASTQDQLAHRLGGLDQGGDALGALGAVRVLGQGIEVGLHARLHQGAAGLDHRFVDEAEPGVAREVCHGLELPLGRGGQAVVAGPRGVVHERQDAVPVAQASFEDPGHHPGQLRAPGLGAEQQDDSLLQVRAAVQVGDAVAGQDLGQAAAHLGGQAHAVGVQPLDVPEQVLAGGRHALVGLGAALTLGPPEQAQVGEQVQEAVLSGQQLGVAGAGAVGERALLGKQGGERGGVELVAQQVAAEGGVHPLERGAAGGVGQGHPGEADA